MFRPMRLAVLVPLIVIAGVSSVVLLPAVAQNPIQSIKDAYNKAKQQSKQQQQTQTQQQGSQSQAPAQTAAAGGATTATDSSAPWTPPSDATSSATPGVAATPVQIDPTKLPDILGVHLGMTLAETMAAAHKAYPDDMFQEKPDNYWPPSATKPEYGYNILNRTLNNSPDMIVSFSAPPDTQRVWMIARLTYRIHTNRNTLLAALRQKYGKETIAFAASDTHPTTNDAAITVLKWLYDEQGNRVAMPPGTVFPQTGTILDCPAGGIQEPNMPKDDNFERYYAPWCQAHLVMLTVTISPLDIVESTTTVLEDIPLAIRNAHSAAAFLRDYANKQHQEDLQKSKENKPTL